MKLYEFHISPSNTQEDVYFFVLAKTDSAALELAREKIEAEGSVWVVGVRDIIAQIPVTQSCVFETITVPREG